MKRAILSFLLLAAMGTGLISCGTGSNPSNSQTSNIKTRAFVSNVFAGQLQMIDYKTDQQTFFNINVGSSPQTMVVSGNKASMLVFNAGNNSVSVVDTKSEAEVGSIALPNWTDSMVISSDAKAAWAAVRNSPVSNSQSGTVEVMDLTKMALGTAIPVPLARRIVSNPAGTMLLAFSDGPVNGAPDGQITIIDLTKTGSAAVTGRISTGVSRPVWGVFSSDGSKAYIVNCGQECGGAANSASVSVLDMTTGQLVPNAAISVPAGSMALLDGNNLFVAGTAPGVGGVLTKITVDGSSLAVGNTTAIGDGYHTLMIKGATNKLFIGANPCTNSGNAGCLSIFDTAGGGVVVDQAKGFVTGMTPIPNRNIVYVVEGGELRIYDTTTSTELTGKLIDIVGNAFDVKTID